MEQETAAKKLAAYEEERARAADIHRQTQAALSESENQLRGERVTDVGCR
jgi:hypothetical protein